MSIDILIPVAKNGGVENVINETAVFLKENGINVRIIQLVWEGDKWANPEIEFYPLIFGREGHDLAEFVMAYKDFLSEHKLPDMILATAWPYASYIAKAAVTLLKSKITVISWLHTLPSRYTAAGYGDLNALDYADLHFAISDGIKREILSNNLKGPVIRINNPVNTKDIPTIPRSPEGSTKNLLFVGRLSPEKHPEILIESISKTAGNWNLHFWGSGEKKYEQSLLALAKRLRVNNNIHFHGWHSKPWLSIDMGDALALASEYEGFPLSAVEANAAGLPVISSAYNGVNEIITPGENGYIFEKNNPEGLAQILDALTNKLLPDCNKEICQSRALPYDKDIALRDFYAKLKGIASFSKEILISKGSDVILYTKDKISVIIPCYNVEDYIGDCLDSVLTQSISKEFYEIICINDASTDQTLDILLEYESLYPDSIMVINCETNMGQGALRNLGTYTYASGNYIVYIDSDDIVNKDYLEILYENISLFNTDFSMAGYYKFNKNSREDVPCIPGYFLMDDSTAKKEFIIYNGVNNSPVSKIYRRNFIIENNIRFPENIYMEDILFYQKAMMTAKSVFVFKDCIYGYRFNENSTMNETSKKYNRQLNIYEVQKQSLTELTNSGLLTGYYNEFALVYYVRAFVSLLPEATIESVDEKRREVLKTIKKETLEVFPDFFDNPYINADKSEYNTKLLKYFRNL